MFDTSPQLDCAGRLLKLDVPRVMGIVNVTPDSFSDGGEHADVDAAIAHAMQLVAEGADILDIGGESTRPGAAEVSVEEELRRTIPVIEALARRVSIPISIDTSKPEVMRAAVAAGAGMINDVCGLRKEGALDAASALGVPVVLMHMQGEPRTMQAAPNYDDVVGEVHRYLAERIFVAEMAGKYLQPSPAHHPLLRYWTPDEFKALEEYGDSLGFSHVASGPMVRSSYHADRQAAGLA